MYQKNLQEKQQKITKKMSLYDYSSTIKNTGRQINNNKNYLNNNLINNNKTLLNFYYQKNKCLNKACIDYAVQMEHSYSRDCRPIEGINGLTTRTLMVHKTPQCPSCHTHPLDEGLDSDEANNSAIPSYNENAAKDAMNETKKISENVRNLNSDDDDWEERVPKIGWTPQQEKLFSKITRILDMDNLSRLATIGKQHEPVHRRVTIDRSVHRFRQIFASISWDSKLTQWLHGILIEYLPPIYMAIYLDILQTLKTKLPTLMDKMLFGKPMNINQDLLTPVLKKQWEPVISIKPRKLPTNTVILIVPSTSYIANGMPPRMQKWCQLFATMGQIFQVQIPNAAALCKQPIEQVCEHLVQLSRLKVQEIRREQPNSHIVLVGFNAGASLALQISLTENINSIVCLGFAYNTINGVRGAPDDQILDITIPIMFVIGQNSARTSQEEMESLREKMQSETSLVVVGSADDVLRVPKSKRQIEGVTQSMVDSMIMDEIYDFVKNCILNPPGPRQVSTITTLPVQIGLSQARKTSGISGNQQIYSSGSLPTQIQTSATTYGIGRKRKISQGHGVGLNDLEHQLPTKLKYIKNTSLKPKKLKVPKDLSFPVIKRKVGRPRTRPLPNTTTSTTIPKNSIIQNKTSNEILNMAIQSILPENSKKLNQDNENESQILSALELLTQSPKRDIKSSSTIPTGVIMGSQQQHIGRTTLLTATGTPQSTVTTGGAQKFKMIQTNQFIHMKPSAAQQNTQRIYTIKTSPILSSTNNQNQVFALKTPGSQLTSTTGNSNTSPNTIILNSPPKFTVFKTGGANVLNTSNSAAISVDKSSSTPADLSSTNILDLPILFADNDGNIHDTAPMNSTSQTALSSSASNTSAPSTIILNQQGSQSSTISPQSQTTGLLSKSTSGKLILNTTSAMTQQTKPNKVVYINRNSMKPMSANLLTSRNLPSLKYTKVVVTNPKTAAPSLVPKASSGQNQRLDVEKGITTITIQKPSTSTTGISSISSTHSGIVKASPTTAIIGNSNTSSVTQSSTHSSGIKQFQPIIINVDSDKAGTFKNIVKVGGGTGTNSGTDKSQIKKTILFKPGSSLKTLPVSGLKSTILNRNLTVRKVVNILQAKPGTTLSQLTQTAASSTSGTAIIRGISNNTATTNATASIVVGGSSSDDNDESSANTQNILQIQKSE